MHLLAAVTDLDDLAPRVVLVALLHHGSYFPFVPRGRSCRVLGFILVTAVDGSVKHVVVVVAPLCGARFRYAAYLRLPDRNLATESLLKVTGVRRRRGLGLPTGTLRPRVS